MNTSNLNIKTAGLITFTDSSDQFKDDRLRLTGGGNVLYSELLNVRNSRSNIQDQIDVIAGGTGNYQLGYTRAQGLIGNTDPTGPTVMTGPIG